MEFVPTEHQEQTAFVHWFRLKYQYTLIFAIPNGGKRHINTAKQLKNDGVVSGIPDLYVPCWKLWIEMKRRKGGSLSAEQKKINEYLIGIGDDVIVGYGSQDAIEKVEEFLRTR